MLKSNELCRMVKVLAYTHIWIAFGAFGAAVATALAHGLPLEQWNTYTWGGLSGIGVATGCIYTLQRHIKLGKNPAGVAHGGRAFLERWKNSLTWGWGFAALGWTICFASEWNAFLELVVDHIFVFATMALIALGYASNPFTGGRGWRGIPHFKWPAIALAWGLATGWLPLQFLHGVDALGGLITVQSIGVQTLFIAGITLPFDVRDLRVDPPGLYTVPQQTNAQFTFGLALGLVLLSITGFWALDDTSARAMAGAFAMAGVLLARRVRGEWVFSLWLDGSLILQGVLAFLFP